MRLIKLLTGKTPPALAFKLLHPGVSSIALFQLSGAEQRQYEKVCQNVDDAAPEDYDAETLGRRKIRQDENGETGGDNHI
jgi:hypothetical protein